MIIKSMPHSSHLLIIIVLDLYLQKLSWMTENTCYLYSCGLFYLAPLQLGPFVVNVRIPFFIFFNSKVIFHYVYLPHFLYPSSINGHFRSFHIFADIKSATVNMGTHILTSFPSDILSEVAKLGVFFLCLLKKSLHCFHNSC